MRTLPIWGIALASGLLGLEGAVDGSADPRRHGAVVGISCCLDPFEHLGAGTAPARGRSSIVCGAEQALVVLGSRAACRTRAPLRESCLCRSPVPCIAAGQVRGDPDGPKTMEFVPFTAVDTEEVVGPSGVGGLDRAAELER